MSTDAATMTTDLITRPRSPRTQGRLVLTNVRAVLPDRILDDATVVCEQGHIVEVVARHGGLSEAVDGGGAWCLPGLVDTHSDGLEKEIRPRPTSTFDIEFAVRTFEGRLAAAGISTAFHGLGYEDRPGIGRTIDQARRCAQVLDERRPEVGVPVDHRLLHRVEARSPGGLEGAESQFLKPDAGALDGRGLPADVVVAPLPLVSFEDHSPGQGQYRDLATFVQAIPDEKVPVGMTREDVLAEHMARAEQATHLRTAALERLSALARAGRIRLLAHDCEDAEQVTEAHDHWGAAVAEFPLTIEAATRACELGMSTVMGAPNVLLGGSHSGNVAAEHTVRAGVCGALASDYLPASMLAAAFALAERGAIDLIGAVALVTSGPAQVAGLTDRGCLAEGQRADLLLVDYDGRWPTVRHRWLADELRDA